MKEGWLCAIVYCLYVIGAKVEFSIGWLIFWLFFPLIVLISIFGLLFLIGLISELIIRFCCSKEKEKKVEKINELTDTINETIKNGNLDNVTDWLKEIYKNNNNFVSIEIKDKKTKKRSKKTKKSKKSA